MSRERAYISRWQKATGSELANARLFVTELCELLDLPRPNPATGVADEDACVFERRELHLQGDGSENEGRIDCYRKGSFVLEAKKLRQRAHTKGIDDARLRAHAQAQQFAQGIPPPNAGCPSSSWWVSATSLSATASSRRAARYLSRQLVAVRRAT